MTATQGTDWEARLDPEGWWVVVDSNDDEVCHVGCGNSWLEQGDAEYIAVACNAHGPLVEALEAIVRAFEMGQRLASYGPRLNAARAALKLARGDGAL